VYAKVEIRLDGGAMGGKFFDEYHVKSTKENCRIMLELVDFKAFMETLSHITKSGLECFVKLAQEESKHEIKRYLEFRASKNPKSEDPQMEQLLCYAEINAIFDP